MKTTSSKDLASRYTLIKGSFWIHYPDLPKNGPEPDGDTVSFKPDNRDLVRSLRRYGKVWPDFNGRGVIPIRFEAIDTLETHFAGTHQELTLGNLARDRVLHDLGFREVKFWPNAPNKIQSVKVNPLRGHLLANGIEGHGRVLALVYPGEIDEPDGKRVWVDPQRFDASLNGMLLREGLAYAELYTSLPIELARHARDLARTARENEKGVYADEHVGKNKSALIADLEAVQKLVMWPKLFRRLVSYFQGGNVGLGNLDAWIRADPTDRDDRVLLPASNGIELGNMHDLYNLADLQTDRLRMTQHPEDLVILPDET